jgi:MSHA biogenesis protein MshL
VLKQIVLNKNIKINRNNMINHNTFSLKTCLALAGLLILSACAHQSKVQPSKGHIDSKAAAPQANQNEAASAPIPKLVKTNPQLPVPKPTQKSQTYSVVVNEVPVKEILFALARESKLNIDIHPAIQGRVTLNAVDQTLPAILERLARQVDLTYKMESNVLYITPDQPVLRLYKVDYVNMNRDTKGFIGAAAEISTTGQSASTGAAGSTATTSTSGNGANNSSRTSVDSSSQNHLWESLVKNVRELLAETDKEVIVSRIGTSASASQASQGSSKDVANAVANKVEAGRAANEERNLQQSEYKTLFAANVIANPETGVISVRATSKQHEKVQEFIDKVMGSARKQVLIEATIVEVRLSDSFQAGIDWSRFGNNANSSGFNFNGSLGPSNNPADGGPGFAIGYLNPVSALGNLASSVTLLKQFGDTKVISSPKLMVLNNQTAILKVVDNLVYFTVQAQQSQGAVGGGILATVTTTPNTVPVGIVMSVTPQINETTSVNINVRPTISRVLSFVRDPNPALNGANGATAIPSEIPQIQVREMESILQVNSGNTAILGGLMQDEIQRDSDKVPGLSDIPGVGQVFTGKDYANGKTELVIFLRPTVIPNASLESDELQSYKQYLPAQQLQNVLDEAN